MVDIQAGVLSGEQTRKLFEHARENKVSRLFFGGGTSLGDEDADAIHLTCCIVRYPCKFDTRIRDESLFNRMLNRRCNVSPT